MSVNSSSKTKVSGAAREVKIRAFPTERRRPRGTLTTGFLFLLALAMIAAGVLGRFGERIDPSLARVAGDLTGLGLEAGTVFVGGCLLLGVALASRQQRQHVATLLSPGAAEEALTDLGADVAEIRNKLYELGNDQVELRSMIQRGHYAAEEHYRSDRADEIVQGTFRLAGSLDSLHAKLEHRLTEGHSAVLQSVHELASLIEASRDYLQESLEESQNQSTSLGQEMREWLREQMALRPEVEPESATVEVAAPPLGPATAGSPMGATRPQLAPHHDASEWFRAGREEEPEPTPDFGEASWIEDEALADGQTGSEEEPREDDLGEELRMAAVPEGAAPVPSSAQETRLGFLDRLNELGEESEVSEASAGPAEPFALPQFPAAPRPPSRLAAEHLPHPSLPAMPALHATPPPQETPGDPAHAMSLLNLRFDHPPQPPLGQVSRVEQEPDGTTVVRLDEPYPPLPSAPPPARPTAVWRKDLD